MFNFKISLILITLIGLVPFNQGGGNIYQGKSITQYHIYYDPQRDVPTIEIHGIKYGYYDYLTKAKPNNQGLIATSKVGSLFKKDDKLFYTNSELRISIILKFVPYSKNIDAIRSNIFEIKSFFEISRLRDSLHVDCKSYSTYEDYQYYRDNKALPQNYIPAYKKKFFDCASQKQKL